MDDNIDMYSEAKLSKIELLFENCEHCIIPKEAIELLYLENFNSTISYSEANNLHAFRNCSLEKLQIKKDYLLENHSFMGSIENSTQNLLDRIVTYNDIVSIQLYWIIDNVEYTKQYYLPWNDEDEFHNKYQTYQLSDSTLSLRISKKLDERLVEICNAALEINKEAEDYVAIFVDGRGTSIPKDMLYFIFKDDDGQKELYDLSLEDLKLCQEYNIIGENVYKGFHNRKIYRFDIEKIRSLLGNRR